MVDVMDNKPQIKRRWYQFSLWTIFVGDDLLPGIASTWQTDKLHRE
jgi:hypothetical protein